MILWNTGTGDKLVNNLPAEGIIWFPLIKHKDKEQNVKCCLLASVWAQKL